jgi:hypothetical protein
LACFSSRRSASLRSRLSFAIVVFLLDAMPSSHLLELRARRPDRTVDLVRSTQEAEPTTRLPSEGRLTLSALA